MLRPYDFAALFGRFASSRHDAIGPTVNGDTLLSENGKAAWLLGAAFSSEGAIPFAAADPLRVIPAGIVGGAVTGAITMAAGVTSQAPHGGLFVFFAIGTFAMFVVAIAVGTVVSALIVIAVKRSAVRKSAPVHESAAVPVAA